MNRLDWLERELERDDLDTATRAKYDTEANLLADRMSQIKVEQKIKAVEREEREKLEQERLDIQYVEESLHDLAIKIAGDKADQWLETALKLYSIDLETNQVTSIAHGPHNPEYWDCDSHLAAKQKILQLIRYKYRDHFERGNDFFWYPEEGEAS